MTKVPKHERSYLYPMFKQVPIWKAAIYSAIEEGEILSGASAFIRSSKYMECQVNTVEAHRRRGLAALVSAAFIDKCRQNDKIIPWDAGNMASANLGKSLGYEKVKE